MTRTRRTTFAAIAALSLTLGLVGSIAPGASAAGNRTAAPSVSFPGIGGVYKMRVAADARCGENYLEYVVGAQGTRATHFYGSAKVLDPLDKVVGEGGGDLVEVGGTSYVSARFCRSGIYTIVVRGTLIDMNNGADETVGSVNDRAKFDVVLKRYLYTPQVKTSVKAKTLKATIYPSCGNTQVQKLVGKKWTTKKTFKAKLKCIDEDRVVKFKVKTAGKWRFNVPATKYSRAAKGKTITVK